MADAEDETYRDAKNLHSKYLRHQAFEREIAANKDRLMRLQKVCVPCINGNQKWACKTALKFIVFKECKK
ncbi:hypothetical protein DPMN_099611 [Dreissena polymorpha]|uniref:Uncharacterized protein n=1 Tax=Dreissena polymorpha TaxID=45954 RepID=A0A9D4LFS3_DREPO|nr:hypothetical protein DPMN_099611 [Dreissena polymorpha]